MKRLWPLLLVLAGCFTEPQARSESGLRLFWIDDVDAGVRCYSMGGGTSCVRVRP